MSVPPETAFEPSTTQPPTAADEEGPVWGGVQIAVGFVVALPALGYAAMALGSLSGPTRFDPLGELGWPLGLAVALFVLALISIARGAGAVFSRKGATHTRVETTIGSRGELSRLAAICLSLVAYGYGLRFIGFEWVTLPFIVGLLYAAGYRRPVGSAVLGAAVTVVVWLVFEGVLNVRLP